ncbi:MAG: endonuclease/exonuclease/phosphatase family protein [Planctomycetota bacterium]|nr:MAG: endonuclease/exonuclease/phosphatase family protein [Planctomycetota bacterium]
MNHASASRYKRLLSRLLAGLVVVWWGSTAFGRGWFLFDVLASWQAQILPIALLGCAGCLLLRRRSEAAAAALACGLAAWPLVAGRPLTLPRTDLDSAPVAGAVRIVSLNIDPRNPEWLADLRRVWSWQPDIVVLIESSPEMWRAIVRNGLLDGTEWLYHERRAWVGDMTSPCFVLSRWPLERLDPGPTPDAERDVLLARVERPEGAFVISAVHPHSPRSLERWVRGNAQIRTTAQCFSFALKGETEPLVVGADLNSGPAGWRGSAMRAAGLSMCKPVLGGWGSFPSGVPGALRVQLDDVWVSDGARPVAWASVEGLGSDHCAVVVDVVFER